MTLTQLWSLPYHLLQPCITALPGKVQHSETPWHLAASWIVTWLLDIIVAGVNLAHDIQTHKESARHHDTCYSQPLVKAPAA